MIWYILTFGAGAIIAVIGLMIYIAYQFSRR